MLPKVFVSWVFLFGLGIAVWNIFKVVKMLVFD